MTDEFQKKIIKSPEDLPADLKEQLDKLGLTDAVDWSAAITPNDILYLLDRCPFLQIVSTDDKAAKPFEIIRAPSGWDVHSYGEALSSSPGRLLFADHQDFKRILKEEGDEGGSQTGGRGTIYQQAFDTAVFMVALAKKLGWPAIYIVDGHPRMQWAAWFAATENGLEIGGFTPTEEDYKKRDRVKLSDRDIQFLKRPDKKP